MSVTVYAAPVGFTTNTRFVSPRRLAAIPPEYRAEVAAFAEVAAKYAGRGRFRAPEAVRARLARLGADPITIDAAAFEVARRAGALAVGGCR